MILLVFPKYLEKYLPMQLRDKVNVPVDDRFPSMNFGNSKGLTFPRVLIYPTKPMMEWAKNNQSDLASQSRSKLYVAVTRAKYSVALVYDYNEKINCVGISNY